MAAFDWDGPSEIKTVQPSHKYSYERLFHDTGVLRLFLPLHNGLPLNVRNALMRPRLERAIGVIYRPETELASHYFQAVLPEQFDEYIWFDETSAVSPLKTLELSGMPDTYPFGLQGAKTCGAIEPMCGRSVEIIEADGQRQILNVPAHVRVFTQEVLLIEINAICSRLACINSLSI